MRLKDLSIDERFKAWCCVCGWAHQGLTAGFLLLRYSVEYTFESLALFYPLFISRFVCTRRLYNDKLGIFHVNQTSICLDPSQKKGWVWYRQTCSSPPVKRYWPFQRGAFCGFFRYLCLLLSALLSPAGKGPASWVSCMRYFLVFLSCSHMASRSVLMFDCIDWESLPYS